MLEQFEWFCAVLLVIGAAVLIGAVCWWVIDLLMGGPIHAARERRCAMPKRIKSVNGGAR
ncbi:hypothetical protein WS89_04435 [Burkholderia sp. MSMB1072]|uniref:hypothetical protein n=1 Tax=Burkholderia sp. MSMB1072 TaxID=1637871 RepID=UPI000753BF0D|nr:hypothetical protein [Burkholderia sp. MSMB1072]KVH64536.1 hypothetical protein WS89_04435 [Burkholderia sp. MSMB1072]